ncbi:MAG: DMT family transporter [Chloroflexota bacterium]|nr:MAG: DMT family transporter [Chloroflexota bacterium]
MAAASWGLGTVVSKHAVAEIPPVTLLFVQLASSVVGLGLLMRWRGIALRSHSASPILGRLGLLNPGLAYALGLLGLAHITASLSVLLWALEPLMILVLAAVVLRERIGLGLVGLSLVAVAGITLVIYQPGGTGSQLGVALTLAGVACCAVYTIIARQWLGGADSTAQVVLSQQVYALGFGAALLTIGWALGTSPLSSEVSPLGWASAVGSGLLYYGLAYWFYLSALRQMPASSAAASFYLIPIFGVAGSLVILGERLDPMQWLGAALVLVAVFTVLRRAPNEEVEPAPRPA